MNNAALHRKATVRSRWKMLWRFTPPPNRSIIRRAFPTDFPAAGTSNPPFFPVVICVKRYSADVASGLCSAALFALLGAVVALCAEWLVVVLIPEQLIVATMRNLVIHYRGSDRHTARLMVCAQRMLAEILYPVVLPVPSVTALGGRLAHNRNPV